MLRSPLNRHRAAGLRGYDPRMKNIQVDSDGEMRCWNCGGKHFQDRRTTRAHLIGYTTVGIGALATKKKLRCKLCGKYNDTGSADPYTGASATPTAPAARAAAPAPAAAPGGGSLEVKVLSARVSFDGNRVTIKRIGQTSTLYISEIESVETYDKAGFGAAGVWFRTAGATEPLPKKVGIDPHGFTHLTDTKHANEVRQLVDAVRAALS